MNALAKFFDASAPVAFAGKDAGNAPAFRWYDKDRMVHGRRLEDHLRFAVCYWHSFCWPGSDPFGGETMRGRTKRADFGYKKSFRARSSTWDYCARSR